MSVNFKELVTTSIVQNRNVLDDYKHFSDESIRDVVIENSIPIRAMFCNVLGDLNIGSMIRSASLFGFEQVYIFGRRRFDRRSTVGSTNYIPTKIVDALEFDGENPILSYELFRDTIVNENLYPIFIETDGENVIGDFCWTDILPINGPIPCIIMGNESDGIPPEFLRVSNEVYGHDAMIVSIRQKPPMRSLNVSVAFGIVGYDIMNEIS